MNKETKMLVAGVDEAGRGPLAGNVFAAAVILPIQYDLPGLTDSKKIKEKNREILAIEIKKQAIDWNISFATVSEINELNILHATMLAMKRAILGLRVLPQQVLIDGNRIPSDIGIEAMAIVKGDNLVKSISAASILAKTARDEEMRQLGQQYPQYGFEYHKGYGTRQHLDALSKYGVLAEHRKGFSPIKQLVSKGHFFGRNME